jgi:hypothetical protein
MDISLNIFKTFINMQFVATEDLIVLFLMYHFLKILFSASINELIWPTQFFNRRHTTGLQVVHYRTYTETIEKFYNVFIIRKYVLKSLYRNTCTRYIVK